MQQLMEGMGGLPSLHNIFLQYNLTLSMQLLYKTFHYMQNISLKIDTKELDNSESGSISEENE